MNNLHPIFQPILQTIAPVKTKNPNRGYVFGIKTVADEYVCQKCMAVQTSSLDGFKLDELKERTDCTICGAWIDYIIVES